MIQGKRTPKVANVRVYITNFTKTQAKCDNGNASEMNQRAENKKWSLSVGVSRVIEEG